MNRPELLAYEREHDAITQRFAEPFLLSQRAVQQAQAQLRSAAAWHTAVVKARRDAHQECARRFAQARQ